MGRIKSNLLKSNKGINDSITPIRETVLVEGKQIILWVCPYYVKWNDMLNRCYRSSKACYAEITVCDEWKYFSNFRSWCESQPFFDSQLCLDKDTLNPGAQKYSPENCRFIPMYINNLMVCKSANNGLPLGVTYDKSRSKYKSNISVNGKNINSPRYDTPLEAHHWWQENKIYYLQKQLDTYISSVYYIPEIANSIKQRIEKIQNELDLGIETFQL